MADKRPLAEGMGHMQFGKVYGIAWGASWCDLAWYEPIASTVR